MADPSHRFLARRYVTPGVLTLAAATIWFITAGTVKEAVELFKSKKTREVETAEKQSEEAEAKAGQRELASNVAPNPDIGSVHLEAVEDPVRMLDLDLEASREATQSDPILAISPEIFPSPTGEVEAPYRIELDPPPAPASPSAVLDGGSLPPWKSDSELRQAQLEVAKGAVRPESPDSAARHGRDEETASPVGPPTMAPAVLSIEWCDIAQASFQVQWDEAAQRASITLAQVPASAKPESAHEGTYLWM